MTAQLTYASRRRVLALSWGGPRPSPAVRATLPDMAPMDTHERARTARRAQLDAQTPDERRESAARAARASHGVVGRAKRLAGAWDTATDDERREARRVLREAGVIR